MEEQGLSCEGISKKYGIKGTLTVPGWVRKFGKPELLNKRVLIDTMEQRDQLKALEKEVQRLKLALADSLLAQRSLEVVISEANKEYKTDLKKSFGESPSNSSAKSSE